MSTDTTSTENTGDDAPRDVPWQSLSIFLEENAVEETYNDFFIQVRANHREVRDLEKRVIQLAVIEVAMKHPDEVADTALTVSDRVGTDTEWSQENLYLPRQTRSEFNDVFFGELKVEHDGLYSVMKRVLQEASLVVGMDHLDEVAERAAEADSEYVLD